MKTLRIMDFAPHSFIVVFGDDSRLIKRVIETQNAASTTTVIDDDKQPGWVEDKVIQQIARSGRYDKTSLIVRISEPKDLPTHIKYYLDYVILPQKLYRDCVDCDEKRRLLWKAYGQGIPSYENFISILDSHSVVIANGQTFVCVI